MIFRFDFGNPFCTEAVTKEIPAKTGLEAEKEFSVYGELSLNTGFSFKMSLQKNSVIYGFGQSMGGINKKGRKYISYCTDDPVHTEGKDSLYGAHNFFIIHNPGEKHTDLGFFFDYPGRITFDIAFTETDRIIISAEEKDISCYVIKPEGKNPLEDITRQFREIIGRSYIPPRWALGYMQSRWGYRTKEDIESVYENYTKAGIPLDSICMDIDYMVEFKDFTIDGEKFPSFPDFVSKLKKDGVRLVPIIDAGVKIEPGYDVYEEGVKNNYFCKKADGKDYVAGVWPGRTHFPDFLNPEARRWFGLKYKVLTDTGVEGFWNDMNEPAMFYSDEGLSEAVEALKNTDLSKLDINGFFAFKDKVTGIANNENDYKRFYHRCIQNGKEVTVNHHKIHNLFGYNMTRAAAEGLNEINPSKRFLLFSRASYIGMHRYGGIWTGDNSSWWSHIKLELSMMPGLNMCGILYTGADIGGFGYNASRELLMRWIEFGLFTPLMRNHAALGTRDQECYRFENPEDFARLIRFRYRLIPYIYTEYMKSALKNTMYFRPLSFVYPEDMDCLEIEDQLMVGDSLMVAPVLEPNSTGRNIYLPEDMIEVRLTNTEEIIQTEIPKGRHYIKFPLDELVFYIRKGHALPLAKPAMRTDLIDFENLSYIGDKEVIQKAGKEGIPPYKVYIDDGFTTEYKEI